MLVGIMILIVIISIIIIIIIIITTIINIISIYSSAPQIVSFPQLSLAVFSFNSTEHQRLLISFTICGCCLKQCYSLVHFCCLITVDLRGFSRGILHSQFRLTVYLSEQ